MRDGARGIQSVEVSGRILRALVKAGRPMMLKDLSEAADLKPAQCHAYLASLKNVDLVRQNDSTGLYSPGSFALRLGVSWLNANPQTRSAIGQLKMLAQEHRVMSLIVVWGSFGPTIAHAYAGWTQASLNLRQGSLFSITGSATGRIFAAFSKALNAEQMISAELDNTSEHPAIGEDIDRTVFEGMIREIRGRGYSIARGRPIPEINAIASPVFDNKGELVFAASLIGSAENLSVNEDAIAIQQMLHLSHDVSESMPQGVDLPNRVPLALGTRTGR